MPLPNDVLETLPEELRDNETLNNFNDIAGLAKSYVEARSMLGNAIRIPGEDAPPEDREKFLEKLINNAPEVMIKPDLSEADQAAEFYKMLGRPDDPTAYEKPEEAVIDPDVETELRTILHEAGLTNAQFKKVLGAFSEREVQRQEFIQTQRENDQSDLKGKWGVTFDDRLKAAEQINNEYYPGRDFTDLNPADIEALYRVHESLTGKAAPAAHQPAGEMGMTPDEAKERAAEIMRKVHDPNSNLNHEEKMQLIRKRMRLMQEAGLVQGTMDDLRAVR